MVCEHSHLLAVPGIATGNVWTLSSEVHFASFTRISSSGSLALEPHRKPLSGAGSTNNFY